MEQLGDSAPPPAQLEQAAAGFGGVPTRQVLALALPTLTSRSATSPADVADTLDSFLDCVPGRVGFPASLLARPSRG
jgi:hypothetical protein